VCDSAADNLPSRIFLSAAESIIGDSIMAAFKLPSFNQLITLAIALVILFLIVGFLPENVKKFFRV